MEGKEEISDTDSGIILHSGPDSPCKIMKDVITHTRAVKLKHQSLEDRLELCLLELKKLCIREAELTGRLSADYPLLPGEQPPQIRQRIGAAFKLDEQSIPQGTEDSELNSVEAELSLQLQIYKAAQRLCHEEHLSKAVKRSRLQQCKREEKKVKQLQETAFQLRLQHGRSSPRPGCISTRRDQGTSDDSALSDSALLDEEEVISQSSEPSVEPPHPGGPVDPPQPPPTTPTLEELQSSFNTSLELEPPPIEHSPWTESSLDQPYQKTKKKSHSCSSKSSSSPAVTPVLPPVEACYEDTALPLQFSSHLRLCHTQSNSAPSTPEMHLRRQLSLRLPNSEPPLNLDKDRGRTRVPRRLLTDYVVTSPGESPVQRGGYRNPIYNSNSETEDSNSEHSALSYTSSPCHEMPCDLPRQCQPTYRYQHSSPNNNHGPMAYPPGPGFYQNHQHQSTPSFHRGYYDHGIYPSEMDMARLYHGPLPPCHSSRYEHWYEEAPVHPQRALTPLPPHIRLSRAPSLREYPHHPSRGFPHHPSRGFPRQVVNEELKSWHQRNQFRPRSLDRQVADRVRNVPGCESPLSHHHKYPEQAPQRRVLQRAADGTPVQWFVGDDSELVSQV
ncbi:innate immunity activator protein-like isoform X1 [Coregonus clupeaformis]|uniref:innate immunity activator protein-like isoform X1 n=1 Tax=Coregonus clupeaformis TaxID=59861 RepID=UPI001E1C916F|nr:innate immunity activator protein-like isoform X1 [Coregonus clupeaformis]XP_045068212.1 innate immunity activator protein-like isoform X1 [Coregonus clupeaformis]XP_045068213.1 innate immunity activator protein-like isoform X1 [Coregonus clupeaformis]